MEDAAYFRELIDKKKAMRVLSIKVIVAAVYADWKLVRQERKLLRQFRRSAFIKPMEKLQVRTYFRRGLKRGDIQISGARNGSPVDS